MCCWARTCQSRGSAVRRPVASGLVHVRVDCSFQFQLRFATHIHLVQDTLYSQNTNIQTGKTGADQTTLSSTVASGFAARRASLCCLLSCQGQAQCQRAARPASAHSGSSVFRGKQRRALKPTRYTGSPPSCTHLSPRLKLHHPPRPLLVQDAVAALAAAYHVCVLQHVLDATLAADVGHPRGCWCIRLRAWRRTHCSPRTVYETAAQA